jgi:hypothetical protein
MIQLRGSAEDLRPHLRRLARAELGSWRKSLAAELNFLRSTARHRLFKTLPTGLSHPQHISINPLKKKWPSHPVAVPPEVEVRRSFPGSLQRILTPK